MHSGRMHTARSSGRSGGVSGPGGCLVLGCLVPGVSALGGVCSHGVSARGGGVCLGGAWWRHPTVDRIRDACKNITLPQLGCGW